MTTLPDRTELPEDGSAGFAPGDLARLSREDHLRPLTLRPAAGASSPTTQAEERLKCAQQLETYIQRYDSRFRFTCEHAATLLLADEEDISPGGALCADDSNMIPSKTMKDFLQAVSPLCRHYMLHFDPNNLTLAHWKHAVPVLLDPQPEVEDLPEDHDYEAFQKSLAYHTRFSTNPELSPVLCDPVEETKCMIRDQGKCVVTGKPSTRTFWIIPFTWNDTVEHNDATGDLRMGSTVLTRVNLAAKPYPVCNAHTLGATHKTWNMVTIDETVYRYMNDGFCALEYQEGKDEVVDIYDVKLTLVFKWMPKLKGRFGMAMDIHQKPASDWTMMCEEMDAFQNCAQPSNRYGKVFTRAGDPLLSGQIVKIKVPKQDAPYFKSAIKVHLGSIVFTAFVGAAGRPWLLSGKDPRDKSMQKLQDNARLEGDARLQGDARPEDDASVGESSKGKTTRWFGKVKDGIKDGTRSIKNEYRSFKDGSRKRSGGRPSILPFDSVPSTSSAPGASGRSEQDG